MVVFLVSVAVVLSLVVFALFHIYGGVHDSLSNARVGSVYNFEYLQPLTGDYTRHMAKVTSVTKLNEYDIGRLNAISKYRMFDKNFHRSNTLVTCEMKDGTYRQFYGERATRCYRPMLGRHLFTLGVAHLF
jgi:hypothetical protein